MDKLEYILQLDDCLAWIAENKFKRLVIQLKGDVFKHAARIVKYLHKNYKHKYPQLHSITGDLDPYITQTNTCCLDLLVTQHVSDVDAIIHIGQICLTKPFIKNQQSSKPVLFVFGRHSFGEDQLQKNIDIIVQEIRNLKDSETHCQACILYDTNLVDLSNELRRKIHQLGLDDWVEVSKLYNPDDNWHTPESSQELFLPLVDGQLHQFGHFLLKQPVDKYSCAIHLGKSLSIQLSLAGPSKLININCHENMETTTVNLSRMLNKRMALVGQLKDQDELRIGVLITNPLPDMDSVIERLRSYSKARKHLLYFISMIQTIDECKIGNFDLCDAFIVVNACTCSTILESLVFNRPIITELEFKLACGLEAEYGRVLWPGSDSHLSVEDMINKRKVSDVSLALAHTRNELLERCSKARTNKWSGMDYKTMVGDEAGGASKPKDDLKISDGLSGIASTYSSEPLKKE